MSADKVPLKDLDESMQQQGENDPVPIGYASFSQDALASNANQATDMAAYASQVNAAELSFA
jgi:hypothetical protein